MADDDDIELNEEAAEPEGEEDDLDVAELDEETLVGEPDEEEFEGDELVVEDDDLDEAVVEEESDDDTEGTTRVRKRKAEDEEEDDDDDLLTPDDVEADLDRILKDRMVAAEDEEDEDEEAPVDDRGETGDGIQPKRADETLCSSCFLLVRPNAPGCPVEDDNCPIFN